MVFDIKKYSLDLDFDL